MMEKRSKPNGPRRVLLLTGASRGIGHATVKRFSAAGWRVITVSRQPFPEQCPWEMGPEDHIQLDLSDPAATEAMIPEIRARLAPDGGMLHALVITQRFRRRAKAARGLGRSPCRWMAGSACFR